MILPDSPLLFWPRSADLTSPCPSQPCSEDHPLDARQELQTEEGNKGKALSLGLNQPETRTVPGFLLATL